MINSGAMDDLIQALRAGKVTRVRAAIKADPNRARHARVMVEAARLAFQPAAELLHRAGGDLNAVWRGYRPLHALLQEHPHASNVKPSRERLDFLDWMLKHGADPEQPGAWPPARAIIIAAFAGEPAYIKRLRKASATIDGFTGAALGDRKVVEQSIRKQPGFAKTRDPHGLTALQCAAGSRLPGATLEIARLLLDAGADVRARTRSWDHDVDAIQLAAGAKNKKLFELLLERGADPTESLAPALWNAPEEFADVALARGADPDRAVAGNQPLLNNLIRWGQIRQSLWLLEHRANPNLGDERGWTAVHQAASRGNERMMRAVLDAGGNPSLRDKAGWTPLDIARGAGRTKLVAMMSPHLPVRAS